MFTLHDLIAQLKTANYQEKQQLFTLLLQTAEQNRQAFSKKDKEVLLSFAYEELDNMCKDIPRCATYREKDLIFASASVLFGCIVTLDGSPDKLPPEKSLKMRALADAIKRESYIESAVDNTFSQKAVTDTDVTRLLYWAKQTCDEYQRGRLFFRLLKYHTDWNKLTGKAKLELSDYIAAEILRLMEIDTDDAREVLQLLAAFCLEFPTEKTISALYELLKLEHNSINYYVIDTLCSLGRNIPQTAIEALAQDLVYANLTYLTLLQRGKVALFPSQYATEEYLAKSALVHWLIHPTELDKQPDEIVYIGKAKKLFSSEVFHIFKFRSDSKTLDSSKQNRWLIGWTSNQGSTFSEFEEFAPFENLPTEKALKLIIKKIVH